MKILTWRQYPFLIAAFDCRRWENHATDFYVDWLAKKWIFWKQATTCGPTHLQYHSPFGFLLVWPLCFHIWYQFKPQKVDANGTKIPGSETVFYFRIGWARWAAGMGGYMIPTLYLGLHWD